MIFSRVADDDDVTLQKLGQKYETMDRERNR